MAYTPGLGARVQVVVPPQLTATVTITRASGASLIVHSDAARSSGGVTMPATVTGTQFFYLRTDDLYTFSATVNGVECAMSGSTVGSFTTYLSGDTTLSVVVDRETAESSGGGGAGLASPTFTGDPKAPTPAPGDNDTSVATTAFVHGEIATQHTADNSAYVAKTSVGAASGVAPLDSSSLVPVANLPISSTSVVLMGSGAPSNGLGLNGDFYINDANGDIYGPKAIGAWGSVIGNFALLASPAFTGNPTAPTQSAGNNSTRLATTAYADASATAAVATEATTARAAEATNAAAITAGALAAPVAFTAGGTWTPSTTGRQLFRALVVGGGGAGAPGSSSNGGGGGGGGEVLDDFYLGNVTSNQTVTIGAGGATGGASGGNTSIGSLAIAVGGVGSGGQTGGTGGDGALGAQNINNNPVASGGGGWGSTTSVAGTKGGPGTTRLAAGGGGGGGPTSASGGNGGASTGGAGGTGAALGGGGGGAGNGGAGTNGTSGVGGTGANAPANTGGGGGGGGAGTTPGGAGHGGSGYVIIYQVA